MTRRRDLREPRALDRTVPDTFPEHGLARSEFALAERELRRVHVLEQARLLALLARQRARSARFGAAIRLCVGAPETTGAAHVGASGHSGRLERDARVLEECRFACRDAAPLSPLLLLRLLRFLNRTASHDWFSVCV